MPYMIVCLICVQVFDGEDMGTLFSLAYMCACLICLYALYDCMPYMCAGIRRLICVYALYDCMPYMCAGI